MLNRYKKSDTTLFIRKAMRDMMEMKAELNEHRYYLERNVERRTEHLLKRVALLESCNATLCNKLASAHEELIALKQQLTYILPNIDAEPNDRAQPEEIDHIQMEMSWHDVNVKVDTPPPSEVLKGGTIRDAMRDEFAMVACFPYGAAHIKSAHNLSDP